MRGHLVLCFQEILLWTRKDCQGTEFEKHTRTWFYFGVSGCQAVSGRASLDVFLSSLLLWSLITHNSFLYLAGRLRCFNNHES